MAHKTRSEMPREWPIARKGTKYYTVANHDTGKAIPLVIALRDILGIVKTRREARYMLLNGELKVNGRIRKLEAYPVRLFDIVSIDKMKKSYKLIIDGKKVNFKEVSGKEENKKTVKIIGKVMLAKDKFQMNLDDGTNFIAKEKFGTGDSVVLSLRENKIEKIVPMKEGAKVLITSGKHAGKEGKVLEIKSDKKEYSIKLDEGEVVLPLRTLLAVD